MGTAESFAGPARTFANCSACPPTAPQERHSERTTSRSRVVTGLRLRARMNSSRLRMMPYFVKTRTSGFRLTTLLSTKSFRPLMTERTETTVITPMITPRSVSPDRSLFTRRAWVATASRSLRLMARETRGLRGAGSFRLGGLALLFGHPLDAVAVLDLAKGLERSRDDLFAWREPRQHLHLQLSREPRPDGNEGGLAVPQGVDALLRLQLSRFRLLPLGRVAHHHGGQGHGRHFRLLPRDDVGRDRKPRPD